MTLRFHVFFRHRPARYAILGLALLAAAIPCVPLVESSLHRREAERVAAAHIRLMSALAAHPLIPRNAPENQTVAAVLRATAAAGAALAQVPDED